MSVEHLTWAWKQSVDHSAAKFVLVVIADHANREGDAFVSVEKIAERTELYMIVVRACLVHLADRGLLYRVADGHFRLMGGA